MFGVLVEFIVAFIDTAFLGRVSELALNTAGNAGLIYITFYMAGQGLAGGVQIIVARRYGANRFSDCGKLTGQSIILLFLFAVILYFAFQLFGDILVSSTIQDSKIAVAMTEFLNYRTLGYFVALPHLALISFYTGIGRTNVLIGSTFVLSIINIIFDYILIHGHFGFPAMGANGAALASVLAESGAFIFIIIYTVFFSTKNAQFKLGKLIFHTKSVLKTLRLGSPLMLQRFLSLASWTIFFMFIEKLGSTDLAASQVVRTLYFIAFIPIMGFSVATKTFVSQALGNNGINHIKPIIKKTMLLGVLITLLTSHGAIFYPELIVSAIVDDVKLITQASNILMVIFPSMIMFSIAGILTSTVAGTGNTRMFLLIEAFSITAYLTLAYLITIVYPKDVTLVWMLEYIYFGVLLILALVYLKSGHWKKIKV